MAKIHLHMLSQDEKDEIHAVSLHILEQTGMQILEPEAREILSGAGCRLESGSERVRFPPDVIETALRQAPSEFRLYGRDTENPVLMKPGQVYFTTNGYAIHMFDPASGSRHTMTQADLAYATRLADAMDQLDVYSVIGTPHDAPPATNDRNQLAVALLNTTKHIWNTAYGREGVEDAVRMAAAVRGGREALRRYPLFTLDLTTLSPLQLDGRQAGTMIAGAREGLPIGISPGPIAGATGPVTLAGTLALANAEVLGAITLVQATNPGTPVVFTQYTRSLDMATGSVTMGGPEFSLLRVATAEMAAYYNLPSRGGGLISDSKAGDAQMGAEKMLNCVLASLSGLTVLAGAGLVDFINTFRPDQLLIDNEIIGSTRRLLEGIRIDSESLAAEVIAQVGPGGNYLAHEHTAGSFRRELWFPKLWDRRPWSVWEQEGGRDVARRAAERLEKFDHRPAPLPADVEAEIWATVREAEARHA